MTDPCSTRVPLLIDLHGYSESATGHETVTRWHPFVEERGGIAVTPQAGGDPPAWDLDADVAVVADVIDDAVADRCADPDRVYVTGYSLGGFLISHVACRLSDRIAAVAPVAGVRAVEPCEQTRPVPALIMHGTADEAVLLEGGIGRWTADVLDMPADGPSIPAIATSWAVRNGCGAEAAAASEDDNGVTVHRYPCPGGADVELHVIDGGPHEWPPFANEVIWSFLERHALG